MWASVEITNKYGRVSVRKIQGMAVCITLRTSCRQRWRLISRRMASGKSLTRADSSTPRRAAHRWRSYLLTLWQTSGGSWRLSIHHSMSRFRSCISSFLLTIERRKTWDVCPSPHEFWHLVHFQSLRRRSNIDISQRLKGWLYFSKERWLQWCHQHEFMVLLHL